MQVKDLIYAGFRIAGVLANAGRNFLESGSHYQDAFAILNAMLDSWNTERLTVFSIKQHDQNLVPLQQTYTIGPGGDWNAPRPSRIERANLVYISANPDQPLEIPIEILTLDGWKSIPLKNVQSVFPLQLYYDAAYDSPVGVGNVSVFPVPQVINIVRLFLWQIFGQFASVDDSVAFPPGYLKAIQYNLAREIAMRWPETAKMSPLALQEASDAKEKIKLLNTPMLDLACDEALVNRPSGMWNWRTGNYAGHSS
jgi:hypothetical protein